MLRFSSLLVLFLAAARAYADFKIVALPDVQYYSSSQFGGLPAMYTAQTDWIQAHHADASPIAYVASLGDMTDHGDTFIAEWQVASDAMSRLETPFSVPYGSCVGNHDETPNGNPNGTTTYYNQFFGVSRFSGRGYYGGHYGNNNNNHFDLFSADGQNYIAIYLCYDANNAHPEWTTWAANLLTTYSTRKAIIVAHYIGDPTYPATFGAQGQRIYNAVSTHANVFLMLSGHVGYVGRRQDKFGTYTGQAITTLVSNHQFDAEGGGGYMRIYDISTARNTITSHDYSPYHNLYNDSAKNQFQVQKDWVSRLDIFYRGPANTLKHKWWNGSVWSAPEDLGGTLTSDPAAVSRGAGLLDIFYKGSDNTLWQKSFDVATGWTTPVSIGDSLVGKPAASSYLGTASMEVYYRGADNALKHRSWNGTTGWGTVESVGGNMGSDPVAVGWGQYRRDVFYRGGADTNIWHAFYEASVYPWTIENMGGNVAAAPAVASWGAERLDIFQQSGGAHQLWHKNFNGSVWSNWIQDIATGTMATSPSAASWGPNRIDEFHKGADGHLWQVYWNGSTWAQFDMGTTDSVGDFAVASWSRF